MDKIINIDELRMERNAAIICEWQEASHRLEKGVAPTRVMREIAIRYGITPQAVDKILRAAGEYAGSVRTKTKRNIIH